MFNRVLRGELDIYSKRDAGYGDGFVENTDDYGSIGNEICGDGIGADQEVLCLAKYFEER